MKTSIVRWGNSQGVRLPKELLEAASLKVGDSVSLTTEEGGVVIRKAAFRHRTLEERFAGYTGDYRPGEWDTGSPVGEEEF